MEEGILDEEESSNTSNASNNSNDSAGMVTFGRTPPGSDDDERQPPLPQQEQQQQQQQQQQYEYPDRPLMFLPPTSESSGEFQTESDMTKILNDNSNNNINNKHNNNTNAGVTQSPCRQTATTEGGQSEEPVSVEEMEEDVRMKDDSALQAVVVSKSCLQLSPLPGETPVSPNNSEPPKSTSPAASDSNTSAPRSVSFTQDSRQKDTVVLPSSPLPASNFGELVHECGKEVLSNRTAPDSNPHPQQEVPEDNTPEGASWSDPKEVGREDVWVQPLGNGHIALEMESADVSQTTCSETPKDTQSQPDEAGLSPTQNTSLEAISQSPSDSLPLKFKRVSFTGSPRNIPSPSLSDPKLQSRPLPSGLLLPLEGRGSTPPLVSGEPSWLFESYRPNRPLPPINSNAPSMPIPVDNISLGSRESLTSFHSSSATSLTTSDPRYSRRSNRLASSLTSLNSEQDIAMSRTGKKRRTKNQAVHGELDRKQSQSGILSLAPLPENRIDDIEVDV